MTRRLLTGALLCAVALPASAQRVPVDKLPKPAPADSLGLFVRQLADVLPAMLVRAYGNRPSTSTLSDTARKRLYEQNKAAMQAMSTGFSAWEYPDSVVRDLEISAQMRGWVLMTEEFRESNVYLGQSTMRLLAPVAVEGIIPQDLELLGRKILAAAPPDSVMLAKWQGSPRADVVFREAAERGDPRKYDAELLGNSDYGEWWVEKARAHLFIGTAEMARGRYDEARAELDSAYVLGSRQWEISMAHARLEQRAGRPQAALVHFARAVQGWNSTSARVAYDSAYGALHGGSLAGSEELLDSVYRAERGLGSPVVATRYAGSPSRPHRRLLLAYITALH